MSSVPSISSALSSALQTQLTTAVANKSTADAKAAATVIQQTQSRGYLSGLLGSMASDSFAASETLQVMNSVLADSNAAVLNQLLASSQAATPTPASDITNTPFTQTVDENGQAISNTPAATATNAASSQTDSADQVAGDLVSTPFTQTSGQILDVSV